MTIAAGIHEDCRSETCDLCIVGAGVSGLNALHVAAAHLPAGARVILVERRPGPGGMWTDTYDYVRLHQPHAMFTVGDIRWNPPRPRAYLATGAEVHGHLRHCLGLTRRHFDLLELYGHEMIACEERALSGGGAQAHILCRPVSGEGPPVAIVAQRMIDAVALDVPVPGPLALTSGRVVSTTPHRLGPEGHLSGRAPAYVVGGGKTAMDTVLALRRGDPERPVTLINGPGTVFANRDTFLPAGLGRWWRGQLLLTTFADLALRFDGRNEAQVFDHFRDRYAISPDGTGERFFFGLLSEAENAAVAGALRAIIPDYLQDVEDGPDGPSMVLRGGARHPVAAGSVFVNCTGHLLRGAYRDGACLSPGGACLTVSTRAAVHFQPAVAAYFLSHLFFSGGLRDSGLYEIDLASLFRKNRRAWTMTAITQSLFTTMLLLDALPMRVVGRCGLDLDRWYPLPRRALGLMRLRRDRRRCLDHCRRTLDTVGREYGIRCGPLG